MEFVRVEICEIFLCCILPPTQQYVYFSAIIVDLFMNIEVLDEKPLNSHLLSCSIPMVICFMFSGCFKSINYWVLRILVIINVWGEIHGSLEGLELKIRYKTLGIPNDKPCYAASSKAPQSRPLGPGAPRQPDPIGEVFVHQDLNPRASHNA